MNLLSGYSGNGWIQQIFFHGRRESKEYRVGMSPKVVTGEIFPDE